jgi:DNA-binding SARP family transcriptional activator
VDFRILGPLQVIHDGGAVPLPGARQRELLTLLLLDAGQVVSSDRLMEALWGVDQPAAGRTALRVRVSQLRKALRAGGDIVETRPTGYALRVDQDGLDLWRFERALADGERMFEADPERALDALRRALSEWRGQPLADVAYAPFAQAAIVRLEELRATALEFRIEAELRLGRHSSLIGELQALVVDHPLRERLWAQLMIALYRDGRQADALAAYRQARARLVEEIGIEPGPQLQALEARILAQDLELAAEPPRRERPARAVLAVCRGDTGPAGLAERLARRTASEAIAVALVAAGEDLGRATASLRAAAPSARVAAFTSSGMADDVIRLAAQQDVALLLVAAPSAGRIDSPMATVLQAAACDVALVGGDAADEGPVLVPFAGNEHDWAAAEVGAWLGGGSVTLVGVGARGDGGRDASRLLANASLALQRGLGLAVETVLVDSGAPAILEAAADAGAIVTGLSDRWMREGLGKARQELLLRAPCPVLLVRRGVRPGGLAPPDALTRFTWSGGR